MLESVLLLLLLLTRMLDYSGQAPIIYLAYLTAKQTILAIADTLGQVQMPGTWEAYHSAKPLHFEPLAKNDSKLIVINEIPGTESNSDWSLAIGDRISMAANNDDGLSGAKLPPSKRDSDSSEESSHNPAHSQAALDKRSEYESKHGLLEEKSGSPASILTDYQMEEDEASTYHHSHYEDANTSSLGTYHQRSQKASLPFLEFDLGLPKKKRRKHQKAAGEISPRKPERIDFISSQEGSGEIKLPALSNEHLCLVSADARDHTDHQLQEQKACMDLDKNKHSAHSKASRCPIETDSHMKMEPKATIKEGPNSVHKKERTGSAGIEYLGLAEQKKDESPFSSSNSKTIPDSSETNDKQLSSADHNTLSDDFSTRSPRKHKRKGRLLWEQKKRIMLLKQRREERYAELRHYMLYGNR